MDRASTAGKWRGILLSCGVDKTFLSGKHCSCPICGGVDRFRFDDKGGMGGWICGKCGAGDGFKLLMEFHKIGFRACVDMVRPVVADVEIVVKKQTISDEKRKQNLRDIWKAAKIIQKGDLADRYLSGRGIDARPSCLRLIEKCRTSFGEYHPAMLSAVLDLQGNPVNIHRTYLGENGKADLENCREMMSGAIPDGSAIRLMPISDTETRLGIAEGVETALSAQKIFNIPVWASINATCLEKWIPPHGITSVVIFGDNDKSFTGQKSSYVLAQRLFNKGIEVDVRFPDYLGEDWNDYLLRN